MSQAQGVKVVAGQISLYLAEGYASASLFLHYRSAVLGSKSFTIRWQANNK